MDHFTPKKIIIDGSWCFDISPFTLRHIHILQQHLLEIFCIITSKVVDAGLWYINISKLLKKHLMMLTGYLYVLTTGSRKKKKSASLVLLSPSSGDVNDILCTGMSHGIKSVAQSAGVARRRDNSRPPCSFIFPFSSLCWIPQWETSHYRCVDSYRNRRNLEVWIERCRFTESEDAAS